MVTKRAWVVESIHNEDAKNYLFSDGEQWWRRCTNDKCHDVAPWSEIPDRHCPECGAPCINVRMNAGYEEV